MKFTTSLWDSEFIKEHLQVLLTRFMVALQHYLDTVFYIERLRYAHPQFK